MNCPVPLKPPHLLPDLPPLSPTQHQQHCVPPSNTHTHTHTHTHTRTHTHTHTEASAASKGPKLRTIASTHIASRCWQTVVVTVQPRILGTAKPHCCSRGNGRGSGETAATPTAVATSSTPTTKIPPPPLQESDEPSETSSMLRRIWGAAAACVFLGSANYSCYVLGGLTQRPARLPPGKFPSKRPRHPSLSTQQQRHWKQASAKIRIEMWTAHRLFS